MVSNLLRRLLPAKKATFPNGNFHEYIEERTKWSPDYVRLEEYQAHHVFVYDEMQERHPQHQLLGSAIDEGCAFTVENFTLMKKRLGVASEAIALRQKYSATYHVPIQGQVFLVPTKRFLELDKYKQQGLKFHRQAVRIAQPYRRQYTGMIARDSLNSDEPRQVSTFSGQKVVYFKAWMYVGVPEYWHDLIDGGFTFSPVKTYSPRNQPDARRYYCFTRMEYDNK